ncbi:MAG TPA: hypothetical protein VIS31_03025 [Woeseiaceae bacterium]
MRRAAKVFSWSAGALLVVAIALLAYLHNADLTIYKGRIERIASEWLGHEVSIDGALARSDSISASRPNRAKASA